MQQFNNWQEEIEKAISEIEFNSMPADLYDPIRYTLSIGGKRMRPILALLGCDLFSGDLGKVIKPAVGIEVFHNFTLLHDDIMDNDEMRHGVPTVHKKFGMPIAILAGDVLFSKAYQIILDSKLSKDATIQLVSRLAKACVDVCEGQILDVKMAEEKRIPSQKEYIIMIGKKTAALFDVSCSMGAICATNNQKDISNLSNFGRNLGIAFQITDDLIGVMGDPKITKKPVGNDLREGKKSLPILMAIKIANGKDKKVILKVFGNLKATKNDLKNAVDVIRSLGIEENVRMQALEYAERAKKSLSKYSGSAKTELIDLLDFVVKRSL